MFVISYEIHMLLWKQTLLFFDNEIQVYRFLCFSKRLIQEGGKWNSTLDNLLQPRRSRIPEVAQPSTTHSIYLLADITLRKVRVYRLIYNKKKNKEGKEALSM